MQTTSLFVNKRTEELPLVLTADTLAYLKNEEKKLHDLKAEFEKNKKMDQSLTASIQTLKNSIQPAIDAIEKERSLLASKQQELHDSIKLLDEKSKATLRLCEAKFSKDDHVIKQSGEIVVTSQKPLPIGLANLDDVVDLMLLMNRKFDVTDAKVTIDILTPAKILVTFSVHTIIDMKVEADNAFLGLSPFAYEYDTGDGVQAAPTLTFAQDKLPSVISFLKTKDDLSATEIEYRKSHRKHI